MHHTGHTYIHVLEMAILRILYAIIMKQQEYDDYYDYCFPSIFTENWLQTCQTALKFV